MVPGTLLRRMWLQTVSGGDLFHNGAPDNPAPCSGTATAQANPCRHCPPVLGAALVMIAAVLIGLAWVYSDHCLSRTIVTSGPTIMKPCELFIPTSTPTAESIRTGSDWLFNRFDHADSAISRCRGVRGHMHVRISSPFDMAL
jgi:hypothetical protein